MIFVSPRLNSAAQALERIGEFLGLPRAAETDFVEMTAKRHGFARGRGAAIRKLVNRSPPATNLQLFASKMRFSLRNRRNFILSQ